MLLVPFALHLVLGCQPLAPFPLRLSAPSMPPPPDSPMAGNPALVMADFWGRMRENLAQVIADELPEAIRCSSQFNGPGDAN